MAKKKQPDFQLVKLKPGRSVKKGNNQGKTDFKSRKLVVPNRKVKNPEPRTIQECIGIIKENTHLAARRKAIIYLNNFIHSDPASLTPALSVVLDHVLRLLMDMDAALRNASMEVIVTILNNTEELQLQSFIPLFVNINSCLMVHPNLKLKEQSLKLLMALLQHHPGLICRSMEILSHLLQLLTGGPCTRRSMQSKNIMMLFSQDIFSQDWRINILEHIHFFLKENLNKRLAKQNSRREAQDVYWDGKSPLFLQIYSEGGLKPFDIEKVYCKHSEEDAEDSEKFLNFLENIVATLPIVFAEEVAVDGSSDDNIYDIKTISNINVIFQIFCVITELLQQIHASHLDEAIFKFLKECIYDKRRFPFSQKGRIFGRDEKTIVCVQLNLRIIHLLCIYLLNTLKDPFLDSVYDYMEFVHKLSPELKYKCIPMIVEILSIFFASKETPENAKFVQNSLTTLCSLFKLCDGDEETKRILLSLFTKISLDPIYSTISRTDSMKSWFMWLLGKPFEMVREGNVNQEILKLLKGVASRSFPCFQNCLSNMDFHELLGLLKSDDYSICDAATCLICNMQTIDSYKLTCISRFISSDNSITTRGAIRLIRMLSYRYLEKPGHGKKIPEDSVYSGKGILLYAQFLLNVALDASNLINPRFVSFDANKYAEQLEMFKGVIAFQIIPSLHWKQHSELFEVCFNYLCWLSQDVVYAVLMQMLKEIFRNLTFLPMHCTIALFKLMSLIKFRKKYRAQIAELCLASLLTISVLTSKPLDKDWHDYNVLELTESMQVNCQWAFGVVDRMRYLPENGYNSLAAYHMLRVCKYLNEKQLLNPDAFQKVIGCLEALRENCADPTLGRQPLFVTLYRYFTYYSLM